MKVTPGQVVGHTNDYKSSIGTYTKNGQIYSSLLGILETKGGYLSVQAKQVPKPAQGDIVIGRITKITSKSASVVISVLNNSVCDEIQGLVELKNISPNCKSVGEAYRPGDIIRAVVMGYDKRCILSTSEKAFGVLLAMSTNNYRLIPISWSEMKCSSSEVVERRKVAKP